MESQKDLISRENWDLHQSRGVAIIVPTLDEEATIGGLIDSLARDPYPNKEIIVVDGGSADNTVDVAKRSDVAKVLKETGKHKCPANARNQGVRECRAEIVCFMDGDADHVSEYFVTNAIEHFRNPKVIGVLCKNENICDSLVSKVLKSRRGSTSAKVYQKKIARRGANFTFIRKSVFEEVGGYPLLGFGEDRILSQKLGEYLKNNPDKRIVKEPSSVAFGRFRSSLGELFRGYVWYGRTMPLFLRNAEPSIIFRLLHLLLPPVYMVSMISIPLVFLSLWFLIPALPYITKLSLVLCESIKSRYKYRLLTPLLDLVSAFGHTIGLLQYLSGRKHLSRG